MQGTHSFPDIYVLSKFSALPAELKKHLPNAVNLITANFPDVYVLSKFSSLPAELKKYLPDDVNLIVADFPDIELNTQELVEIPDKVIRWMENAEVVITDATCVAGLMYRLPKVKWLQSTRTGIDVVFQGLDSTKPLPKFELTRFADTYMGDSIANYVLGQIINVERNLFFYHDKQKMKKWERPSFMPTVRTLKDLTVGLLGVGSLGKSIGKLLRNVGCRVIAFVRNARQDSSECYNVAVSDLSVILNECDYICNVLPSTEKTRGLLDNDALKNCRKKPVFMNVGRGDVIKNASIVKALRNGWISHAILDVFEQEPLPVDDPLWDMPEVHITPHIGAFPQCEHLAKFIADNYLKYISGDTLLNVVDWENGY